MMKRIKRGYEVDLETLAFDIIKDVGPGVISWTRITPLTILEPSFISRSYPTGRTL